MALKSRARVLFFLTFWLVSLLSQGLARLSPTMSPRPSKGMLECWSATFDLAKCSGELLRMARGGSLDLSAWPDCCKAAEAMSSGCLPRLYPVNPFFPQILQMYCPFLSLTSRPLMTPDSKGPSPESVLVGAPAPICADGPIMDEDGCVVQGIISSSPIAPIRVSRDRS
ncbi:hypothetical protein R6Q59_021084 [Mikania micrantha]